MMIRKLDTCERPVPLTISVTGAWCGLLKGHDGPHWTVADRESIWWVEDDVFAS